MQIRIWRLETDIDDCSGEAMGHVMNTSYGKRVQERYTIHRFIRKKNRPAYDTDGNLQREDRDKAGKADFCRDDNDRNPTE